MSLYAEDARSPWAIIEAECDCRLCTDEQQPCRDCGAPKDRDGNYCGDCRADRRADAARLED